METLAYPELFALQDQVLSTVFSVETSFYLTGGTCLHRFHYQRRHSVDLDLFTNDPALFREDVRTVQEALSSASLSHTPQVDSRDFVRLWIQPGLQLDLVNDRVYRHGKSVLSPQGMVLDNEVNICANKLCAILGRDDPKDMFDLYTVFEHGRIDWGTAMDAAARKCVLDPEILELRLSSFPLELLDLLALPEPGALHEMKQGYPRMVEHLLSRTLPSTS